MLMYSNVVLEGIPWYSSTVDQRT